MVLNYNMLIFVYDYKLLSMLIYIIYIYKYIFNSMLNIGDIRWFNINNNNTDRYTDYF